VFALVATAAVGLERVVSEHERRRRLLAGTLLALAALQAAANGALVVEIVRVYSRRA
jgi:hypothetical protein